MIAVAGICLGPGLAFAAFIGAMQLWDRAAEQGFTSRAAYFALWVFMPPLMLVLCFMVGVYVIGADRTLSKG